MGNLLNPVFRQIASKGNNKTLYKSDALGELLLFFEGEDKFAIVRNRISQRLFELLAECCIPNHFLKSHGTREQKVVALEMLPFIVNGYFETTASMASRLNCSQGIKLKSYLLELEMKRHGEEEHPIIAKEHVLNFAWLSELEWEKLENNFRRVMDIIYGFFKAFGCTVSMLSLEFGRLYKDGAPFDIMLADELSLNKIKIIVDDMIDLTEQEVQIEVAKRLGILKRE